MEVIKGQSLEVWEKWIENELTPPIMIDDEMKYVLEAFLELIEKVKTTNSDISNNDYSGMSLRDFAKNWVKIKYGDGERHFNDVELKEIEKVEKMVSKGYEARLVRSRKGSRISWYKKNIQTKM